MRFMAIVGALAIGAAGCGGDDETSSSTSSGQGSSDAAPSKLALELTGKGNNVSFTGPESVAAGVVEISLKSDVPGDGEHAAQLVRVDGEQTFEEVDAAGDAWGDKGKPLAEWFHAVGGVTAQTGKTVTATQVLEPGRYFAIDIGSDAKPTPSLEFEVTEGDSGELPETEASVEMKEYSFASTGLKVGSQQVLVENAGVEPHFIVGAPLAKGATAEDAKKFFQSEGESEGPPPADFENSFATSVMEGGGKQVVELDLKAGKYVFVCFIPDRAGGPPHVAKGMVSEVTVG